MKKLFFVSAIALLLLSIAPAQAEKPRVACNHPTKSGIERTAKGLSDADVASITAQQGSMSLETLINFAKPPCIHRLDRRENGSRGRLIFTYASTTHTDRLYRIHIGRNGRVSLLETVWLKPSDYLPAPSGSTKL